MIHVRETSMFFRFLLNVLSTWAKPYFTCTTGTPRHSTVPSTVPRACAVQCCHSRLWQRLQPLDESLSGQPTHRGRCAAQSILLVA